jgi:hypothetical protein
MHPLAHHVGEDTLAPLLLLGGAWLSVVVAYTRERLAMRPLVPTISAWVRRRQGRSSRPRTAGRPTTGCRGARR